MWGPLDSGDIRITLALAVATLIAGLIAIRRDEDSPIAEFICMLLLGLTFATADVVLRVIAF